MKNRFYSMDNKSYREIQNFIKLQPDEDGEYKELIVVNDLT